MVLLCAGADEFVDLSARVGLLLLLLLSFALVPV